MLELLRKAIAEYAEVDVETITRDTDFVFDLDMNSYDFVRLVGQLEEALCIEVPDVELRDLRTVGEVEDYLREKLNID